MDQSNTVVLGVQWGDEGKGKVIDVLAAQAQFVVRCQGGANAGHTVVVEGRQTILHLLPSGALHPNATCVIGNGVVVDPLALLEELADLGPAGDELAQRLVVSDRAHVVLPWHKLLDQAAETRKGDGKVGTTLRGIGPAYGDKIARVGLRCGDLCVPDAAERIRAHAELAYQTLKSWDCADGVDIDALVGQVLPACQKIAGFVQDSAALLHQAVADQARILFEGAQGIMLDIDYGTYPYVTSSNTGIGGVITGSGLSHKDLGQVIGIVKAYTTRVGEGPLPVELLDARGDALRERGGEYGATTGRPRRCGWLDLVAVRFACQLNGIDTIALTKLDVLSGEPELPVCVGYEIDGQACPSVPASIADLARVTPIYEVLTGWTEDISGCASFEQLPQAAQAYVQFIEQQTGVSVGVIGTGPGREATIIR